MPMSQGNILYLYGLFAREIGVGRQMMISRFEEVLADDDILPSDVDCADVRELLEGLEFVRLTVFKRGRVYATVLSQPEWDTLLANDDDASAKKSEPVSKGGHKSWKRKKGAKTLRPEKPRRRGRRASATPVVEEVPVVEPESVPAENVPAEKAPEERLPEENGLEKPVVEEVAEPVAPEPEPAAPAPEPAPEPEPAAPEPEPAPEPTAPEPLPPSIPEGGGIRFTVTFDPGAEDVLADAPEADYVPDYVPESARLDTPDRMTQAAIEDEPRTVLGGMHFAHDQITATAPRTAPLPERFCDEVWCPSEALIVLYQTLPLDINPLTLLDEDWTVSRSTESYKRTATGVSFPLRCQSSSEPGSPCVWATLRRQAALASGKRWKLVSVDCPSSENSDLTELPAMQEGAWTELDGLPAGSYRPVSPLRELAEFAHLGPWEELLPRLASLAESEEWGEDLAILKEYLTLTFVRLKREHKVVATDDGQRAAFDTGLFTEDAEPIYACFVTRSGDSVRAGVPAWQFEEFSTDARVAPAPRPASYVTDLAHLCLAAPYRVETSRALRRAYGDALDAAIERAMRRARRSHRVGTPAYDPQTDELRLLLPLEHLGPDAGTGALVLARLGDAGYEARAVTSIEHARTCARVVTAELPSWLVRSHCH